MAEAALHPQETKRIRALSALNILDSPREESYDEIVRLAAEICQTPIALVSLVDESRQWFKATFGLDARETPRCYAFCAYAIHNQDECLVVPDAPTDPRFADNILVTGDPNIRFYAGVPLVTKEEQMPVGTLCVISDKAKTLTKQQYRALNVLADHTEKLLHLRETTITLQKQQEMYREQERECARMGRLALMGELVAEIAHELCQPLAAISASTSTLSILRAKGKYDDEEVGTLLEWQTEANERSRNILQRLRHYARKVPTKMERFDINDVVTATADFFDFHCARNRIDVELNLLPYGLKVHADRTQVQQVITNIFVNACEAMNAQESAKRVSVSTYCEADQVVVEISDSGPGLSIDAESAFSAFETTKDDGLGVGLSICSKIVEKHSGKISAQSSEGKGATFRVNLPQAA